MEAAFFDLDKTVISKSSSLALTRPMYRAGLVSRSTLLQGRLRPARLRCCWGPTRSAGPAQGRHARPVEGVGREQVAEHRPRGAGRPHRPLHLPGGARPDGRCTGPTGAACSIVSSSARGGRPGHRRALRLQVGRHRHPGQGRGRPVHGRAGVLLLLATGRPRPSARSPSGTGLDLEGSYAYSDSITDIPMLEAVGHPVAVNPDRELRQGGRGARLAGRATSDGRSGFATGCPRFPPLRPGPPSWPPPWPRPRSPPG